MYFFDQVPSLFRAYRGRFRIGAAIRPDMMQDAAYTALIKRHFNSITAENIMKPMYFLDHEATVRQNDPVRPALRFGQADAMLSFARDNGIALRFHTLVWHGQTPRWFFAENWSEDQNAPFVSAEVMAQRQEHYIRGVMTHVNTCFPGTVYCWDVVNEAIEPDQGMPGGWRARSPWYQTMGEGFLAAAFRAARKYQAPGQELFYNDYNCCHEGKLSAILEMLKKLKAENLVDGMGMQGHMKMDQPSFAACEKAARNYAALGLILQTTELDIHCPRNDEAGQRLLAQRYGEYFDMLLRLREDGINFEAVTFWGVTDKDTWLSGFRREKSYPLLFTEDKEIKPAFDAVTAAPGKREDFRVDQVGYAEGLPMPVAVLTREPVVLENEAGEEIRRFENLTFRKDEAAGESVALLNLGSLTEGTYRLRSGGRPRTIRVNCEPWKEVTDALIKGFYYQRCGCALEEKYAGPYTHGACHTAKARAWEHPENLRDAAGGWHDAGDYGKYVAPGAVAAAHLLYAYLLFPKGCGNGLNIPESGSNVPDILSEARWELEWILKMQREDGAFFHKLTKERFAPFIMPEKDTPQEYLMPAASPATGAACSVCALAAGIWKDIDPAFSGQLTRAAEKAWEWLEKHPEGLFFKNPEGVRTGGYGDEHDTDERFWAACELFALTGNEVYRQKAEALFAALSLPKPPIPGRPQMHFSTWTNYGWADVTGLGVICCLFFLREQAGPILYNELKRRFLAESEKPLERVRASGYGTALTKEMYIWGSELPQMSGAVTMILNWLLTGREDMRDGALLQLHYALGLNPLDQCFITGFGDKRLLFPHHRPSGADGIAEPVPGLISGGPNARWNYPETRAILTEKTPPAKCFLDETFSADTNEIAVYWNSIALLVFSCFAQLTRKP